MIISVKYKGKDVDEGSMPISDVVNALQGFSNAYTKIAVFKNVDGQHTLKVTALKKGSFEILLKAGEWIAENQEALTNISKEISVSSSVVAAILKVVQVLKHLKNQSPKSVAVNGNGNVVIQNAKNVSLVVPKDVYDIFKNGSIDMDLNKVVSPLEKGKIDFVKITAKDQGRNKISETISYDQKTFFETVTKEITQTKETSVRGSLVSLNKERNDGLFHLQNGNRVKYRLVGENPEMMYRHFLHKGEIKAQCIAHMDENLEVTQVDISHIEEIQLRLI